MTSLRDLEGCQNTEETEVHEPEHSLLCILQYHIIMM